MIRLNETHYKEKKPTETVSYLKGILKDYGIRVEEEWLDESCVGTYSLRLSIKGTDIGTNGKGCTKEYAAASAYGEFFERLQNGILCNAMGSPYKNEKFDFLFDPYEKTLTSKELAEQNDPYMNNYFKDRKLSDASVEERAEAYRSVHKHEYMLYNEEDKYTCVPFYSVRDNKIYYLPMFSVRQSYGSNGMSAGNTPEEALVQALSEIVERHVQKIVLTSNISLPDVPDEYIKKFGSARFRMLIEGSDDANNFMLDRCEDGIDIDTEGGKVELLKRVSNVLAGIESPLEREVYISRTAKKCDISPDILKSHISEIIRIRKNTQKKNEWKTIQAKTAYVRDEINPEAVKFRREARAEETIIRTLMMRPEDADRIAEKAPPDIFITSFNKRVYTALLDAINNSEKFSLSLLASEFSPDEMGKISGMIAQENGFSVSESAVDDCAAALKKGSTAANLNDGDISDDQLREMFSSKKK